MVSFEELKDDHVDEAVAMPPAAPGDISSFVDSDAAKEISAAVDAAFADGDPDERLRKAMSLKEAGNEKFNERDYDAAANSYKAGIDLLSGIVAPGDDEFKNAFVALRTNLSSVCYKQKQYKKSRELADEVLEGDPGNVKALYRRGIANSALKDFEAARSDLRMALKIDPKNAAVKKELLVVKKLVEERSAKEKARLEEAFAKTLDIDREEQERKKKEPVESKNCAAGAPNISRWRDEDMGARKLRWENEMARRKYMCDPPEEEIPFEEWDNQQAQERDLAIKEAKEKEKEAERVYMKKKLEARLAAADRKVRKANGESTEDDISSDDEEELTEKELADLVRRTTSSNVNREEGKKLIGDTDNKPKRLHAAPPSPKSVSASPSGGVCSTWNREGLTWEEKDVAAWAKKCLDRCLRDASAEYLSDLDDAAYSVYVKKVTDIKGEAIVAVSGEKKKHIFDLAANVEFEVVDEGYRSICEGILRLPDLDSTAVADAMAEKNEVWVEWVKWKVDKAPRRTDKSNWNVESDAVKCWKMLADDLGRCVKQFAEKFNKEF